MIRKILLTILVIFISTVNAFAATDFNEYLKKVKSDVNNVWVSPSYSAQYTSDVYFKIMKDGSIKDLKLVDKTKAVRLDNSAIEAVNKVNTFEPLPSFYNSDYIEVTLSFNNEVNKSIKKTVYSKKKKKRITSYKKTAVMPKTVKIKKVIYSEYFICESNYQDKMKDLVLNLDIQKARRH